MQQAACREVEEEQRAAEGPEGPEGAKQQPQRRKPASATGDVDRDGPSEWPVAPVGRAVLLLRPACPDAGRLIGHRPGPVGTVETKPGAARGRTGVPWEGLQTLSIKHVEEKKGAGEQGVHGTRGNHSQLFRPVSQVTYAKLTPGRHV